MACWMWRGHEEVALVPHAPDLSINFGCDESPFLAPSAHPADFPPNQVLHVDGGYVELPVDTFSDFDEATVEAWVKWALQISWKRLRGWKSKMGI